MYRNFYLFKKQVDFLNHELIHGSILDCFTHRRDELVLEVTSHEHFFVRIGLQLNLPYILLYPIKNIKDPKIKFFPEILGKTISEIKIKNYDKSICLICEKYNIEMIFYGKNPNIYLYDETKTLLAAFKKMKQYKEIKEEGIAFDPANIDYNAFVRLIDKEKGKPSVNFISQYTGGFNQLLAREICYRCGIQPETKIGTLKESKPITIIQMIAAINRELNQNKPRIYLNENKTSILSLVDLTYIPDSFTPRYYRSTNEAWQKYLILYRQKIIFEQLMERVNNGLNKKIHYLNNALNKIKDAQNLEQKKKEAELKGNLLLTYSSELNKGIKEIEVKNIFSENNELIKIKLNPAKSIPANAQKYFDKYKNVSEKKIQLAVKKETLQADLAYWKNISLESKKISTIKQAEKLYAILISKKIVQQADIKSHHASKDLAGSFRHLLLGKKWQVFIGKNARNNDQLTFKFAHKYDLWFHAQGVTGSHVIIRLLRYDQFPPQEIIEQAASIAAFYSTAKHATTVPVTYTQVRYVRKPHKAPAGTVIISHEKTIFAEPKKFI